MNSNIVFVAEASKEKKSVLLSRVLELERFPEELGVLEICNHVGRNSRSPCILAQPHSSDSSAVFNLIFDFAAFPGSVIDRFVVKIVKNDQLISLSVTSKRFTYSISYK